MSSIYSCRMGVLGNERTGSASTAQPLACSFTPCIDFEEQTCGEREASKLEYLNHKTEMQNLKRGIRKIIIQRTPCIRTVTLLSSRIVLYGDN